MLGTLFLAFASIMSLSFQNASNFYLPNILTHAVWLIASMLSLIIQKPYPSMYLTSVVDRRLSGILEQIFTLPIKK